MKFKVGDMVRLTRKGIKEIYGVWTNHNPVLIQGWVIEKIEGNLLSIDWTKKLIHKNHFELVPEEPEFGEGEMIEVSDDWKEWERRIFLYCIPNVPDKYLCVHKNYEGVYLQGWDRYDYQAWLYARKLRPQLTRKEIAEKFWVSEDFTLID